MCSGHHPFDYGRVDEDSESQLDADALDSWDRKASSSYARNDRRVRKRIVDERVDFPRDIWGTLHDGMLANLSKGWLYFATTIIFRRISPANSFYLSAARRLCQMLLQYNPQDRATIHDAFASKWIQCDIQQLADAFLQRVGAEH